MCRDGGMVDTGDLKSPGPKRPCGFESRSRYSLAERLLHAPEPGRKDIQINEKHTSATHADIGCVRT